jgi:hypothetical protein
MVAALTVAAARTDDPERERETVDVASSTVEGKSTFRDRVVCR